MSLNLEFTGNYVKLEREVSQETISCKCYF